MGPDRPDQVDGPVHIFQRFDRSAHNVRGDDYHAGPLRVCHGLPRLFRIGHLPVIIQHMLLRALDTEVDDVESRVLHLPQEAVRRAIDPAFAVETHFDAPFANELAHPIYPVLAQREVVVDEHARFVAFPVKLLQLVDDVLRASWSPSPVGERRTRAVRAPERTPA